MLSPRFAFLFLLPFVTCSPLASALTARIDATQGAPRLMVDGQPTRARIFWGMPGASPLALKPEWQHIEFDFTASDNATNGTMHFRFGEAAGDIYLDDIEVEDDETKKDIVSLCDCDDMETAFHRDWTSWPTGAANTVGRMAIEPNVGYQKAAGLHVNLQPPPAGSPWPDFHIYHQPRLNIVAGRKYHVTMWARATPARSLFLGFYRPGKEFVHLGGPSDVFSSQIKLAADAGVNLVSTQISLPWPKPGEAEDWKSVDAACRNVLLANPNALLIARIPMEPPQWWCDAHPDEVMQWEDGSRSRNAVSASPLFRREAAERLTSFITHLEQTIGDHVAGYHPVGQNTGEWFYENTWKRPLNGYAPADQREWRGWLRQHYGTDEALRAAWHNTSASLDTAEVPSAASRHAAPAGIFRDPATEKAILDWGDFQQEAMADCVCTLAKAARQASQGKKLVLFFYGYVFELSGVMNGPATSGHFALRRVLDCPDIDVVCSPISYLDRGPGGGSPSMTAAESVALAGKMWLNEDDTHTYLATGTPPGSRDHVTTIEATNEELTRNVAQEAMRNFGTWWMDLTATGWFKDAAMWKRMADLGPLDEYFLQHPTPYRPEVAAILDPASLRRVAAGGNVVTGPGVYESRAALGRMGAPYGQYLLDDLLAEKFKAKLYVLLDAWSLTKSAREQLLKATRGSTRLWCYAPGYFDGDQPSLDAMKELTGFTMKPVTCKALATPTEAGRKLGLLKPFGPNRPLQPLFAAADAKPEEILATYPDGSAAIALRHDEGGTSLFVGVPAITSELLRLAARAASVHLFTETDCNVYSNGPFIALHASEDGPVELHTLDDSELGDLLSGKIVGRGHDLKIPMSRGETIILNKRPSE
jgi:hypothetical protein